LLQIDLVLIQAKGISNALGFVWVQLSWSTHVAPPGRQRAKLNRLPTTQD